MNQEVQKGETIMWKLEVIKNGMLVMTEWCAEGRHLRGTMQYYIRIHPEHEYRLYNALGELVDGWM